MSNIVSKLASRIVGGASVCVLAMGMVVSTTAPARAIDPIVGKVVLGFIVLSAAAKATAKPRYTVVARLCENKKTGLYDHC